MSTDSICPCEGFIHLRLITNPPGQSDIEYRVGDFSSFRHALLLPLLNDKGELLEHELNHWRPAPNGDLSLQLVEWWAYIADVLTFYNERIANEAYLRTATQPESIRRLIRLLGYRPRPGIGARGLVAALLAPGAKNAVLPQGMGLQNKPLPGKQPQIFEVDQTVTAKLPDAVSADIAPEPIILPIFIPIIIATPHSVAKSTVAYESVLYKTKKSGLMPAKPASSVSTIVMSTTSSAALTSAAVIDNLLLKGEISGLKPGEPLLLVDKGWGGGSKNFSWLAVKTSSAEKDVRGKPNTRIKFENGFKPWFAFDVRNTRLLTPTQLAHFWSIPGTVGVVEGNKVHLDKLTKNIGTGDMLLFEQASNAPALFLVSSYEEVLWYANPPGNDPTKSPDPNKTPPIAILHSVIGLSGNPNSDWNSKYANINIRHGWKEIGPLIADPPKSFNDKATGGTVPSLTAVDAIDNAGHGNAFLPNLLDAKVFLEDAEGSGVLAHASTDSSGKKLTLSNLPEQAFNLKPPIKVLFDLVSVSRGKTVVNEILGSGNASLPGQEFVLKNAPLTYFLSTDSRSGDNYKSTLRVWVDDIEWTEAPSFYGRSPKERIFVTREDENGKTHVLFGDGINGARLASGNNNVIISYRFGSGEETPPAGSLTVILQPQPGLKAIRNPVVVGGGADPDPPSKIRLYAPRSVLAFGRAVSADDYESIALQAPGVKRAKSVWNFDAASQRALPAVYIGDDPSAVDSARVAINLAADPNRPFTVKLARKIPIKLRLVLKIAGDYATQPVIDAAFAHLTDADSGLFGTNTVGIGQSFFQSEIDSACLQASGVVAVHEIRLWSDKGSGFIEETDSKYDPGADGFFDLVLENVKITYEQVAL